MFDANTAIYTAIKAGSIKSVVFFSDSFDPRPAPPYVVIKPEAVANGVNFRIFAHFSPGQQNKLDSYIRYELVNLIKVYRNLSGSSRFKPVDSWENTQANNDDGTISCARTFFIPVIIRRN
jgi:hypothetical protein